MSQRSKPALIELETPPEIGPDKAPPVPDPAGPGPKGQAMQTAIRLGGGRRSFVTRWFWRLGIAALGFGLSVWAWDWAAAMLARSPVLGGIAVLLLGAFVLAAVAVAIRELAAFGRLGRLDRLRARARAALDEDDRAAADAVTRDLLRLYKSRPDLDWARANLGDRQGEAIDAHAMVALAEAELMTPLDAAATAEVESAARQVATATALVPLALADVALALAANLRMIRRIAEIYAGRSGALGSWRLARAVMAHLIATGAVAIGDDLIGSLAGGGLVAKLSRRFGEGVINGALTARVGIAAIEVIRPLPFHVAQKPRVSATVSRALAGLFGAK